MIFDILYPRKCILCEQLLDSNETDLCHSCRRDTQEFSKGKFKISFVARWTALWYYTDNVRQSLLRFKFAGRRHYAAVYGRLLAMKLLSHNLDDFDILTWVPISFRRRWKRGFDQVELIAKAVARELGRKATPTLKKIRHNPPQSGFGNAAQRRANVLGVYRVRNREQIAGKRILLLDDIITSGATVSECAKALLSAGAGEVRCAVIATAPGDKQQSEQKR